MAAAKKVAKKVAKRKSKGKKTVVTMSHIHRFCAAAIADGVRFLLGLGLWPLCLTVAGACADGAAGRCVRPHRADGLQRPLLDPGLGGDAPPPGPRQRPGQAEEARRRGPAGGGGEPQKYRRPRAAHPGPGAHSVRTRANTSGGRRSATCRRAASWSTRPLVAPSNCAETSATAAPAIGARNRRHRRRAGRRRGRQVGRPQQGRRLRRRGRRRRRAGRRGRAWTPVHHRHLALRRR